MKPRIYIARDAVRVSGEKQTRVRLFIGPTPRLLAGFWLGTGGMSDQVLGIAGIDGNILEALAGRAIKPGEIVRLPIGKAKSLGVFGKPAGAKA